VSNVRNNFSVLPILQTVQSSSLLAEEIVKEAVALNCLGLKLQYRNRSSISTWSLRQFFRYQLPKVCSDLLITYYIGDHLLHWW